MAVTGENMTLEANAPSTQSDLSEPFEAILVRCAGDLVSGEMLNVGVILLSRNHNYIRAKFLSKWTRISSAFGAECLIEMRNIAKHLTEQCRKLCGTNLHQGELLEQPSLEKIIERSVQWKDSSILISEPIRGVTDAPDKLLEHYFNRFVYLESDEDSIHAVRQDKDIWVSFEKRVKSKVIVGKLKPKLLESENLSIAFAHTWENGITHALEPLSLDMVSSTSIINKATNWAGRLLTVKPSSQQMRITFLVGMPSTEGMDVAEAANKAVKILRSTLREEADVVFEDEAEELEQRILNDMLEHEQSKHSR